MRNELTAMYLLIKQAAIIAMICIFSWTSCFRRAVQFEHAIVAHSPATPAAATNALAPTVAQATNAGTGSVPMATVTPAGHTAQTRTPLATAVVSV